MEATDSMDDLAASLIVDVTEAPEDQTEVEEEAPEVEDTEETGDEEVTGEDDDEPEEDEVPQEPSRFKVKVDGEEREVTLDELTRSYSGQAYIQKGMQDVAAAKKEVEAAYSEILEGRAAIAALYQQLSSGQMVAAPTPPNPETAKTDPMRYMQQRAEFEQKMGAYQQQQRQIQQAMSQQAEAQEYQQRVYMAEQARELAQRIPELADAEKAGEIRGKLVAAGQHYGFTADEVGGVMDHRALLVLHDAMKYRALQAAKPAVADKAKAARPVVKPGAKQAETGKNAEAEKIRARMKKTRSDADFVAHLLT
ncbi:hypothetical protein [Paracoccus sulfuroxidans]|uniref:Scaffolding protein n=1 Tax=Paracoccus sulfuroxidans TaxID=384678 RepID=A0A562NKK6_9RHOB|nr:hypothetical protein [Paracoccus sulfuroxidans]TWI32735.1 hypothetical protein IQ24_02610 [Paracoccus sulfuroxidans]